MGMGCEPGLSVAACRGRSSAIRDVKLPRGSAHALYPWTGAGDVEPVSAAAAGVAFRLVEPFDEVVEVEAHVAAELVMGDLLLASLLEQPAGRNAEQLRGLVGRDERAAGAHATRVVEPCLRVAGRCDLAASDRGVHVFGHVVVLSIQVKAVLLTVAGSLVMRARRV